MFSHPTVTGAGEPCGWQAVLKDKASHRSGTTAGRRLVAAAGLCYPRVPWDKVKPLLLSAFTHYTMKSGNQSLVQEHWDRSSAALVPQKMRKEGSPYQLDLNRGGALQPAPCLSISRSLTGGSRGQRKTPGAGSSEDILEHVFLGREERSSFVGAV